MQNINTAIKRITLSILRHLHYEKLPDGIYLRIRYFIEMGKILHLHKPITFTEKIQWLKLHNRKDEYTIMVDKLAAKKYVANLIGEQYIIPTIGQWDTAEQIDFNQLPNEFVLKTNNGGGSTGVVICKNKQSLDINNTVKRINNALKKNIYTNYKEWPYKNVKPCVFAEQFMKNGDDGELTDYKFFCFNGVPKYCQVIANRKKGETIDFFDMKWEHQPFYGLNPKCKPAKEPISRPESLQEMIKIAQILSKDIPFVRIDLYYINKKVFFGEITFFPASGIGVFTPSKWNKILGDLIQI